MPSPLYPLLLSRLLSPRLWGGDRLAAFFPGPAAGAGAVDSAGVESDDPIGEAWLVYADNTILNGVHRGLTLQRLADRLGEPLLGSVSVARYGNQVPLLTKLIDAAKDLSIQVHPDDAFAREREAASGHLGKTEAWLVLEAETGAEVIWGFREPVDEAEVRAAVETGTLERYLRRVPVGPGDVIFNPAGTVHAIGAGLLIFEVQQSSDLTYRLYDYGRRGADGRTRELHLDKALAVADLEPGERPLVEPIGLGDGWQRLVASDHFVMDRRRLAGRLDLATRSSSLELLTVLGGRVVVEGGGETLDLERGAAVVIPAALGAYTLEAPGDGADLVRCGLPDG